MATSASVPAALQSAPRLSAVLRAQLTEAPPVAVDEQYLARRAILTARRRAHAAATKAALGGRQLNWRLFAGALVDRGGKEVLMKTTVVVHALVCIHSSLCLFQSSQARSAQRKFRKLSKFVSEEALHDAAVGDDAAL